MNRDAGHLGIRVSRYQSVRYQGTSVSGIRVPVCRVSGYQCVGYQGTSVSGIRVPGCQVSGTDTGRHRY